MTLDELNAEANRFREEGKLEEAIAIATKAVDHCEETSGPDHPQTAKALNELARLYLDKGDTSNANSLNERALKICERAIEQNHSEITTAFTVLALAWRVKGEQAKATEVLERELTYKENSLGQDHPDVATSLVSLAADCRWAGDCTKAESLLQRALKIRELSLGGEHPLTIETLSGLADFYSDRSDFERAERILLRVLKIRESTLGLDHPDTVKGLCKLAEHYSMPREFTKAESSYLRVLNIVESSNEPDQQQIRQITRDLGQYYFLCGQDPVKAEPFHLRALAITEQLFGLEHRETAFSLREVAHVYRKMGDWSKAQSLIERALSIAKKACSPGDHWISEIRNDLALILEHLEETAEVELLYEHSLREAENALGPEHPGIVDPLEKLAMRCLIRGDCSRALLLCQRAVSICEKSIGLAHIRLATALESLAEVYTLIGDLSQAETLLKRVLRIKEGFYEPEHSLTADTLSRLVKLRFPLEQGSETNEDKQSETLLLRAVEINETKLRPNHPETARRLADLGFYYCTRREYAKAESLYLRAFSICEDESISPLASLYVATGEHAKAEPLLLRVLQASEKREGIESLNTVDDLEGLEILYRALGRFERAEVYQNRILRICKRVGSEHPRKHVAHSHLAGLFFRVGKKAEALEMVAKVQSAAEAGLANILSFTSERQRLAYFKDRGIPYTPYHFYVSVALESAPHIARFVFRHKGIVLDSVLEDRQLAQASRKPGLRDLVDQLHSLKQRLGNLIFQAHDDAASEVSATRTAERTELTEEVDRLESELAREVTALGRTRRALSVTVEQVQREIPKDAALLEYLRHLHRLGDGNQNELRYGALVLNATGDPKWIGLGKAKRIDNMIQQFQDGVRGKSAADSKRQESTGDVNKGDGNSMIESEGKNVGSEVSAAAPRETCSSLLQALYDELWTPIEADLPSGTKTVIISPDGALNFLSFATLLTPNDQFLSQKYSIRYVTSGRDLLRETDSRDGGSMSIFGDPDFSGGGDTGEGSGKKKRSLSPHPGPPQEPSTDGGPTSWRPKLRMRTTDLDSEDLVPPQSPGLCEMERRDFRGLSLPALPGTARESKALAEKAKEWNLPTEIRLGVDANKVNLQSIRSPRILYLATHGFFLEDDSEERRKGLVDEWMGGSMDAVRGVGGVRPGPDTTAPRVHPSRRGESIDDVVAYRR